MSKEQNTQEPQEQALNIPVVSGELPLTKEHICFDSGCTWVNDEQLTTTINKIMIMKTELKNSIENFLQSLRTEIDLLY